jgi:accessory colonization factor AcfC
MPTINVRPEADLQMQEVADVIGKSRKVVVVTGAGISTNCGIPVSYFGSNQTTMSVVNMTTGLPLGKWAVLINPSSI